MRKTLIFFGLFVALATAATSQSTIDFFRKVQISSTATDALQVAGWGRFGEAIQVSGDAPQHRLYEQDQAANSRMWISLALNGAYQVRAYDDNGSTSNPAYSIARSGTTVGALTWGVTQQLGLGGSASAPFYSVSGDSDTGMYFPAANQVGIATGGTLRSTWASTGQTNTVPFLAPAGSVSAPAFAFADEADTGIFRNVGMSMAFAIDGAATATLSRDLVGGSYLRMIDRAAGSGARGPNISVGRNSSGAGAAGTISFSDRSTNVYYLWMNSGLLRIHTSAPDESDTNSHTAGSVLGDQTSFLASKDLLGQPSDVDLLDAVLRTKVHHFRYKDGRYNSETFTGIVTDESPWFGKDHNKALNEINAVGYLVGSVRALERRIAELERQLQAQ